MDISNLLNLLDKPPSKGGLNIQETRELARHMGMDSRIMPLNKKQLINKIKEILGHWPPDQRGGLRIKRPTTAVKKTQKIRIKPRITPEDQSPPEPVEYYSWVEGGEYLSPQNTKYSLPNNTQFPSWIFSNYNKYQLSEAYEWNCDEDEEGKGKKAAIFPYQDFIKEYMSYQTPYRGILLYYGLGSGKTRAALEIARVYRDTLVWEVIFISPAALVDNFVGEMGKWGLIPQTGVDSIISLKTRAGRLRILKKYGFYLVSYDAPNKGAQLRKALESETKRIKNKVIIVDEAHNMAQFIHNGMNQTNIAKKNRAVEFYDILYNATNCRFVFLSGTPIINSPSELSVLFNILRSPMKFRPRPTNITEPPTLQQNLPPSVRAKKDSYPVFPLQMDQFNREFVDWKNLQIKPGRSQLFKQRIMGLVAYYSGARGDVYPDLVDTQGNIIVEGDPWTLVLVPMSEFQFGEYEEIRKIEREREAKKRKKGIKKTTKIVVSPTLVQEQGQLQLQEELSALEATQEKMDSTFRIKSRQISNMALPLELKELRPSNIGSAPEELEELYKEFNRLAEALDTAEELELPNIFLEDNLALFSPKMKAMLNQIKSVEGTPQDGNILVYSNFRSIEGIEIFARVLQANGYEWFDPNNPEDFLPVDPEKGELPRFAILGKDYRANGQDNTTEIIRIFNSPENKNGEIIKILLGTSNIAEGLSLFNIRMVLIMEPHWNMVRINQVIGRARRICSHKGLPRDKWNFQVYIYVSVIPQELANLTPDKQSTDEVLYGIAQKKEIVKNQFIHLIKEAAVDCLLNATHNKNLEQDPPVKCLTFPSTETLNYSYFPDIEDDLGRGAQAIATKKVTTKWGPFKNIKDKMGKYPFAYAFEIDSTKPSKVQIQFKKDGPTGPIYIAIPLYDRVSLEHSGEFVLKAYVLIDDKGAIVKLDGKSMFKPQNVIVIK